MPQQCLKIGVKPGDSRNETGQHPEWARCDRSSSEKLGSELARSSSEFLGAIRSSSDGHYTVTTQSLHGHYVVTTRSLRSFLFKGPLGATPAKPSKQKLLTEKTWQRQGVTSSSRSAKIREPASAIKLKPSNKLDCKIRRVYAVFRRIVEIYLTVELRTTLSRRFFCGHDVVTTARSRRGHSRRVLYDAFCGHDAVTTGSRRGHGHDVVTTRSRRSRDAFCGHDAVTTGSQQGHEAVTTRSSETQSPQSQLRARILRFHSRISQKHQQVRLKVEERQGWTTLAQNYCHA